MDSNGGAGFAHEAVGQPSKSLMVHDDSWWVHDLQLSCGNRWAPIGRDSITVGGDHDERSREPAPSRCGGTGTPHGAGWFGRGDRWGPGRRHIRPATRRSPGPSRLGGRWISRGPWRWTGQTTLSPAGWRRIRRAHHALAGWRRAGRATFPTPRRRWPILDAAPWISRGLGACSTALLRQALV